MPTGPATYGNAYADVYDAWYPPDDELDEIVRHLSRWAGPGPVLELGAGTGRLARPLAAEGLTVVALDASGQMLGRLRQHLDHRVPTAPTERPAIPATGVLPVQADMARLPFATSASLPLVVTSRNTLANLTDPGAVKACVLQSADLLAAGGRLVADLALPDPDARAGMSLGVGRMTTGGVVLHAVDHRPAEDLVLGQQLELSPRGTRLRPWALRLLDPADLDAWATSGGLELEHRWQDWSGRAWEGNRDRHISVWYRPPASPVFRTGFRAGFVRGGSSGC